MARLQGYFDYPDGLTPGKRDNGGLSDNLYDNGHLVDRATFFPGGDDEGSLDPRYLLTLASGLAIGAVATFAAGKAAPHVKRWWNDDVLAVIRAKWNGSTKASDGGVQAAATEIAALDSVSSVGFPDRVDEALEGLPTSMGSAEAQQRILVILMAAALIAEQLRRLSNARIENETGFLELHGAMDKLTTQQVTDSINLMLQSNASLLDERASDQLLTFFGGGRFLEGQYVPLRNEKIRDALRLTDRDVAADVKLTPC